MRSAEVHKLAYQRPPHLCEQVCVQEFGKQAMGLLQGASREFPAPLGNPARARHALQGDLPSTPSAVQSFDQAFHAFGGAQSFEELEVLGESLQTGLCPLASLQQGRARWGRGRACRTHAAEPGDRFRVCPSRGSAWGWQAAQELTAGHVWPMQVCDYSRLSAAVEVTRLGLVPCMAPSLAVAQLGREATRAEECGCEGAL